MTVSRWLDDNSATFGWQFRDSGGAVMAVAGPSAEPGPGAPVEVWRSWLQDLIHGNQFVARRWSWVCVREHYFLKIPRLPGQREADLGASIVEAEDEYRLTDQLTQQLDGMVDAPLRLIDACIVKRRLLGQDLWRLARRQGGTTEVQAAIAQGLQLAARLHNLDPATVPNLPVHDYAKDPYLSAPKELQDHLRQRRPAIVLVGYEVRNFMQDRPGGQWKFFDPHEAMLGAPEDDFARYVLSLLMINWGRNARCRAWTHFNYGQLVQTYETARGARLDRDLLAYMFERNVAARRYGARRSARALPWVMRVAARSYEEIFFRHVEKWLRHR
jgi:hypothetical protein